ncbi:MAG: S41 family peptidase [Myxococcales bacterium]|nr:S41 family peptidase [Myxococcales bacterium]MCB9707911.1 S41 family peptidase [Myxococcales bacterium]
MPKHRKFPQISRLGPWLGGIVVGAALAAAAAHALPRAASPYHNLGILARALSHVELSYVDTPDQDRLIQGAIRGMIAELDPHSAYMDAQTYGVLAADTEGRFGGIGVEIDAKDGWLTVLSTFEGGPAHRAGIRPGDRFVSIEGQSAQDMPIDEAVRRMRGEPGTTTRFRLRKGNSERVIDMTLRREIIRVHAVEARVLPDQVAYIRIKGFQQSTTQELERALDEAVAASSTKGGIQGVLLDLRNNPGGLLDEGIRVADEFLAEGIIVTTRGRKGRLLHEARASSLDTRPNWPMVVLVNGFSASAAEIVAGALQDNTRATLVGMRTFGKGSVQNIIELPDGSALKLTIARYYTPSGRSIQAEGIEPDVLVEQLDAEAVRNSQTKDLPSEAGLEGHLPNPMETDAPTIPQPLRNQPRTSPALLSTLHSAFKDDYQAHMGHQVLKALIASRPAH